MLPAGVTRAPRGFTLVEVLIVVAVVGVVAAVAVAAIGAVHDTGDRSACRSNLRQVTSAQEAHYAERNVYADVDALVAAGYLRSAPPTDEYVIEADAVTGEVTVDPPRCR